MDGLETEEETTGKFMGDCCRSMCSGTRAQLVRITFLLLILSLVNHFNALHRTDGATHRRHVIDGGIDSNNIRRLPPTIMRRGTHHQMINSNCQSAT